MSDPQPLRVLLVTDEMEAGGTQRQISLLARGLDPRRFEVAVIYFRNRSFLVDELLNAGVPVVQLPKRRRFDATFAWALRGQIRRGAYDVLHAFSFTGELWSAIACLGLARPRLVSSVRGTYEGYSSWQWRLKGWVTGRSCCVVANSRAGAGKTAAKLGLRQSSLRVVRNGVEPIECADVSAARTDLGLAKDAVAVLYLGRLVPSKNVASLLQAAARIPGTNPAFTLLIAGDGPLRGALEGLAAELALAGRVRFLGERSDAQTLVAASDLLVLPSFGEGLSNVLLEAMAGGRAVLASDVPGNRELVAHDVQGLLYTCDDVDDLVRNLSALIQDPTLRQRLGHAGGVLARREFTVEAMVDAMGSIYSECAL